MSSHNLEKKIIEAFSIGKKDKLSIKDIAGRLTLHSKKDKEDIKKIVDKFVNANIIYEAGHGKYKIFKKYVNDGKNNGSFIIGTLKFTSSGSVFVIPHEMDEKEIFISQNHLLNAIHNDIVKAVILPFRRKKGDEGQIIEVLERKKKQLSGILYNRRGITIFKSDTNNYPQEIIIPKKCLHNAVAGDKVVIKIEDWIENAQNLAGEVVTILGKPGNNDVEMNSILVQFDFPLEFSEIVKKEAEKLNIPILEKEIKRRRDFRNIPTFTIDPFDAKDFDDAISYERLDNGMHRVGIHIADVSHYITEDSEIDKEAYNRGTSVYLVDRVIPMLPEILSNNLCSLRPHEDKLCFGAIFDLDDNCKIHKEWFGKTVINSNRRFNYEEAQDVIENGCGDMKECIIPLNRLAMNLRKKRLENNAINFDTTEVKFILDETGKPTGCYFKEEKDSNRLIEEFMLLANKKVAEKIGKTRDKNHEAKTFIYRIHDAPIESKLNTFLAFTQKLGYELKKQNRKSFANSLNKMFEDAKINGHFDMLNKLSIRLMPRAIYSTENTGHFGLSFNYYTHFTSPIRRYPDLMVHRLFDKYLNSEPSANKKEYEDKCKHSSQMEQLATEAERASIKYKQAEFLSDKIGKIFDAKISGISKWGIFAELNDSKCEGLVPIRKLYDDFYYFDEENYSLTGLHHDKIYRFGDAISVKIDSVNMNNKQIDFEIIK